MRVIKILVEGRVQGVGFRFYTKRLAERLSLLGTVQNLADGRVEIIIKGEPLVLEQFIECLPRMNPHAQVDNIEVVDFFERSSFKDFSILR